LGCGFSSATIGIIEQKKTCFAAIHIDKQLKMTDAARPPSLCMGDGRQIPRLGAVDSYKHMGILRTINGDTAAAARAAHDKAREVTARLRKLTLPVRAMFRAADIVLGDSLLYPGTSSTVGLEDCDAAEAGWRALLTHRSARAMSCPRADVYGPGERTHIRGNWCRSAARCIYFEPGGTHTTPDCDERYGRS
jgi:hypothetical protein